MLRVRVRRRLTIAVVPVLVSALVTSCLLVFLAASSSTASSLASAATFSSCSPAPSSAWPPPRLERRTADGRRWVQRWIKLKGDLPEGFHLTHHSYLRAIRPEVEEIKSGLLTLHLLDKSPSGLLLNEKADPAISSDLKNAFDRIFSPLSPDHAGERGVACTKASVVGPGLEIPIVDREVALGTWQGFYLCEFLGAHAKSPNHRYLVVTIQERSRETSDGGEGQSRPASSTIIFDQPSTSRGIQQPISVSQQMSDAGLGDQREDEYALLHVMVRHTSASISVNHQPRSATCEQGDNAEEIISRVCPDQWTREGFFQHDYEGADDMPGHVKSALLGPTAVVPVPLSGDATLRDGTSLWEHREICDGESSREVVSSISSQDIMRTARIEVPVNNLKSVDITEYVVGNVAEELAKTSIGIIHVWGDSSPVFLSFGGHEGASATVQRVRGMLKSQHNDVGNYQTLEHVYSSILGETRRKTTHPIEHARPLSGTHVAIPIRDGKILLAPGQRLYKAGPLDDNSAKASSTGPGLMLTLCGVS